MSADGIRNWYIFNGGRVLGPFNSAEIQDQISVGLAADSLVWDGISPNWISIQTWKLEHINHYKQYDAWYFSIEGAQAGPFTLKVLSDKIVNKEIPLHAHFWTTGLLKWMKLSELPQLIESAGLLRRMVQRAPFVADVQVKGMILETPTGSTTLSEGGIGLINLLQLGEGAKIRLTIVSQLLTESIDTGARILHQNGNVSSLKFEGLSDSSKLAIQNYISKFNSKEHLKVG